MGEHPIYAFNYGNQSVALFQPGMGALFAVVILEEVIALGCRKFIACGGAGVLDRDIALGHLLIPTWAIQDEGTSYHYLPPAREVAAHPAAVTAIETVLQQHEVDYLLTKTWTTDAIYRETRPKVTRRRAEGCLAVEMEAVTLFAVAQFRGVPLGQILQPPSVFALNESHLEHFIRCYPVWLRPNGRPPDRRSNGNFVNLRVPTASRDRASCLLSLG